MYRLAMRWFAVKLLLALAVSGVIFVGRSGQAETVPSRLLRSFAFPATYANGLTADLVVPGGSTTSLRFDAGKVAIGELPVLVPEEVRGRARRRPGRDFLRRAHGGTHIRLLLAGVVDEARHAVTNAGNHVVIDAVVLPPGASSSAPPFVIPFNITNGTAFIDTLLPVPPAADASVRVQVLGVTLVDPNGEPFGVLGFRLNPPPPAVAAPATPPVDAPRPQP